MHFERMCVEAASSSVEPGAEEEAMLNVSFGLATCTRGLLACLKFLRYYSISRFYP